MKKLVKSFVVITAILFLLCPICFGADDVNIKDQVKKEDGSLFEKIIAECIGGIAQTILDFTTGEEANVGFKDYDTLIFNNNNTNDALSPFTEELWNKTMNWYKSFAVISGSFILIAVFILSYKIMSAGTNTGKKNEVKDSLLRLALGGFFIALAPLFIRFLLYINNSLVHLLVTSAGSNGLDNFLGNSMLTSVRTGNAITTALVIAMFIYLFVKLNIKFIIRQFTLIIFTVFTPIACGLWIINRNATAASVWIGQIVMNIFMQFIYCFLFLIYLAFLPSGGGWAVSLIWAMMILPLADTLQNCLQNIISLKAGMSNDQMANRVIGMGAMLGFGMGAIKEQFKTPSTTNINNNNNNSNSGFKGFVSRAKEVISPSMNLSSEKDYNGDINPIRNNLSNNSKTVNNSNVNNLKNEHKITPSAIAKTAIKTGYNGAKNYLKIGASLAEGNFEKNSNSYKKAKPNIRGNYKDIDYITRPINNNLEQKSGDTNENSRKSEE